MSVPASRVAVRLALAFFAIVLLGWLAGLAATSWLDSADRSAISVVTAARSSAVTPVAELLTNLGSALVTIPLALVTCAVLAAQGRRADALFVALAVAGSLVIPEIVKVVVARARPAVLHLEVIKSYSFPSSHAAHAVGFYCAVAMVGSSGRSTWLKIVVWALAIAIAAIVGWTRMYLGVHYPSDVLGGYLISAAWLAAVRLSYRDLRTLAA